MNKKAFEIQFNWLFVLVAGTAILLFFTAVVIKQKSISETSTKAIVLKTVEAIITGAGVSTDTTNVIDMPSSNIDVSCNRISVGGVSKQYQNLILFAPNLIKGNKLITQTLSFSNPYRVTNFLYVTSADMRYVIIGNSNLAKEINRSLPSSLKKEFYQSTPMIRNENNYKVKIIVFDSLINFPISLEKMPDSDVTMIRVNGDIEKGNIDFYQKDGNQWLPRGSMPYLGKQSLIGAVYIEDPEIYKCNMDNAFIRLSLVTNTYKERTEKLKQTTQLECRLVYSNALSHLNSILSLSSSFDQTNVITIVESAKSLANENKNAQLYSCPLVY